MRLAEPLLSLGCAFALLLTGCDKKPSPNDPATLAARRDSLTTYLAARHSAFERGDWQTWASQLSDSAYLTTADPGRAMSGRDSIQAVMETDYAPAFKAGLTMQITPTRQDLWIDDSAQVAVVTADLDYQITIQDQQVAMKLRSTTLLSRDTGGWKVDIEHYSRPMAYDTLFLALINHQVQAPIAVEHSVPSAAGELITQFRKDIRNFSEAAFNDSAVVVTPGEVVHGADAVRSALKSWLGPPGNATETNTGIRAGLAPGGRVGWVTSTLYVPIFAGPESSVAPIRVLVIYNLAGDHWEIIEAHFSVGWSRLT